MSLRHVFCLFLAAVMPVMGLTASAEVPDSINYQGILLDSGGEPVTTPTTATFTIYDAASDGAVLWDETKSLTPDDQGRFQTYLGSLDPLNEAVFSVPHTFLEVTVSGDTPMSRVPFVTVAYAYRAAVVDGGSSHWQDVDSILYTNEFWGIARGGADNALYGDQHHTMINLGIACTTGTDGQNFTNATISGGYGNKASNFASTVSGGDYNTAGNNWATVGGGTHNKSRAEYATVSGGVHNLASGYVSTVGGGTNDTASGDYSVVAGGKQNVAGGQDAAVGGGNHNIASGPQSAVAGGKENTASGSQSTIGGGIANTADNYYATVAGGWSNTAQGNGSTIGGGIANTADGYYATAAGGWSNTVQGNGSTIGGGTKNSTSYTATTIGGGSDNACGGSHSTICGGLGNYTQGVLSTIAGGDSNLVGIYSRSTIGGGHRNHAGGYCTTIPGGYGDTTTADFSLAAGYRARISTPHHGTFLFADSSDFSFASTTANEFAARCTGGARFVTGIDGSGNPTAGVQMAAGGGSWSSISDRNLKENFSPVDAEEVLEKVAALPVSTWNYKAQDEAIRHIGPMAQDLYASFGVGEDEKRIATVDADGIALAAIQGLYQRHLEQRQENADLKKRIAELETLVQRLIKSNQ
jgi:hypothetical protein